MINLDYPDIDVIRVKDTYYLVTTTMHFLPGCEILSSRDLVHWEHEAYVYDKLDSTPAQCLENDTQIYGKGMWAASLRYHEGTFYICFVCNDTGKTYLYTADDIHGPWKKQEVKGFYHDCSLLFDDGHVYIVYGSKEIYLTELDETLSGPKKGGIEKSLLVTEETDFLGYEGTHFYKINGKYYLFFIHSRHDRWYRVESCFMSDKAEGPYTGFEIFHDDMGFCDQGIAQGGIVDTPDGNWYSILFQDRGGAGRFPVLIPVTWKNDVPVFGNDGYMPEEFEVEDVSADGVLPLTGSDDFHYASEVVSAKEYGSYGLKSWWQFNHEPEEDSFYLDAEKGEWSVTNNKITRKLIYARNMITQRMTFPTCSAEVIVDATGLRNGDYAGICALQYSYGFIGLKIEEGLYHVVMLEHTEDAVNPEDDTQIIHTSVPFENGKIRLRLEADYTDMKDTIKFYYKSADQEADEWSQLGPDKKVSFNLKHFAGCRVGLVTYATKEIGGTAVFTDFRYNKTE